MTNIPTTQPWSNDELVTWGNLRLWYSLSRAQTILSARVFLPGGARSTMADLVAKGARLPRKLRYAS